MARVSGLPTIRKLCQELCLFLAIYIPVVKKVFPDETDIHLALETLMALCCALAADIEAILPVGD